MRRMNGHCAARMWQHAFRRFNHQMSRWNSAYDRPMEAVYTLYEMKEKGMNRTNKSPRRARLHVRATRAVGFVACIVLGLSLAQGALADQVHEFSAAGNVGRVRALVAKGAALTTRDREGNTALHIAAARGDAELAAVLVNGGAPIDATNNVGATALKMAADGGHYDLAQWLVSQGAKPGIRASDGSSVLSRAWADAQWDFVRFLFVHGINPNAPMPAYHERQEPPLTLAARQGEREMVEWLLNQGVDVEAKGKSRISALHEAVRYGHVEIARLLVQHGADVNSGAETGDPTPLHRALAAPEPDLDMVRLLIEHGADVNAQATNVSEKEWRTPVTLAQYNARKYRRHADPFVAFLLQHGAEAPEELLPPPVSPPASAPVATPVCHSEQDAQRLNKLRARDRLARYADTEARLFVEVVSFWEYHEPEPRIDPSLYDTAVVWSLRGTGRRLALPVLFKDGCALNVDTGFIHLGNVEKYMELVELIAEGADSATLNAALREPALALATDPRIEVGPDELISEFESRVKDVLQE